MESIDPTLRSGFKPDGDWGRDAVLWLARKQRRFTLRELGQLAGGMEYATAAQAVSRFDKRLEHERELCQTVSSIEKQLSNV